MIRDLWPLAAFAGLFLLLTSTLDRPLLAQSRPTATAIPSQYLARLERGYDGEDACALISRSGQYRFERHFAHKTEVYVGGLSAEQLQGLEKMLDEESFLLLSPEKIHAAVGTDSIDIFVLDVFREPGLQHLAFNDAASRKPFRGSVGPIVSWFEQLHKLPHTRIPEINASGCMPVIQKSGPQPERQAPHYDYLLGWSREHFYSDRSHTGASWTNITERTCIVVYTDGRYEMKSNKQSDANSGTTRGSEGALSPEQILDLQKILASPDLANLVHDSHQTLPASELEITRFVIPRATSIQRLDFVSYFNVLGNPAEVGGLSNMQYGTDKEPKAIKALRDWLKRTIESKETSPMLDAKDADCTLRKRDQVYPYSQWADH